MKTEVLVLGVLLLVGGIGAGVWGLFTTCSDNPLAQAFLRVPSCSFTIAVTAIGGVLIVVGIVVLARGGQKEEPQVMPPYSYPYGYIPPMQMAPPNQGYGPPQWFPPASLSAQQAGQLFCPRCGKWYPVSQGRFCQDDGSELRQPR